MSQCTSRLLSILVELIDLVGSFLPASDLLRLRSVHTELALKTERRMLKPNFSDLHVVLAVPASLRRALRVAKHSTLGKGVRRIYIYADVFHPSALQNRARKLLADHAKDLSPAMKVQRGQIKYGGWLEDQNWLVQTGNDERELPEIFYTVRTNQDLRISVDDLNWPPNDELPTPRDHQMLISDYGGELFLEPDLSSSRPVQIVLNAIKESNVHPIRLALRTHAYGIQVSIFSEYSGFSKLVPSFRRLRSFSLVMEPEPSDSNRNREAQDLVNLLDFLEIISGNLEHLLLTARSNLDELPAPGDGSLDKLFTVLSDQITFATIKRFYLCNVTADYQSFVRNLAAHRRTLEDYGFEMLSTRVPVKFSETGSQIEHTERDLKDKLIEDLTAAGLP